MEPLKPCPLCGAMAKIRRNNGFDTYRVSCINPSCRCNIGACATLQEAAEKWNRRYIDLTNASPWD